MGYSPNLNWWVYRISGGPSTASSPPRVGRFWSFVVACKAVTKIPVKSWQQNIKYAQINYIYILYTYESGEGFCPTNSFWYLTLPLSQSSFFCFDVSPKSNTFKNQDEKDTFCPSCIESYLRTMVPKGSKVLHRRWFLGVGWCTIRLKQSQKKNLTPIHNRWTKHPCLRSHNSNFQGGETNHPFESLKFHILNEDKPFFVLAVLPCLLQLLGPNRLCTTAVPQRCSQGQGGLLGKQEGLMICNPG